MRRLLMSALVLSLSSLPALAEDTVPERTPWERTDPTSEKVVRWVVEGCAAYPVTVENKPEQLAANADPKAEPDLPLKTGHPVDGE